MEKLLTIIVPTYNMEAYLDKCLTSLIVGEPDSELMRKLDVLVINDGSTDKSSAIAHGYEERYPETFKVIDKENGNYGSCINVALPIATGKYIKILDADDSFDNAAFVEYLTFLQSIDVDMVYSAYETFTTRGKKCGIEGLQVPTNKELRMKDFPWIGNKVKMHGVAYNSLLFKGLNYHQSEGIYYTDLEWTYLPMARVENFVYFPRALYQYLIGRPGQSMEKNVGFKNYKMGFQVIHACIDIYMSCLRNGGKWNGIMVNLDYLHTYCLDKIDKSYFNYFVRYKEEGYVSQLQELDDSIRIRYPLFYKELDNAIHTNPYIPQLQLPFHLIRCWHKYGIRMTLLPIWVVNHYLGMSARIVTLFGLN